MNCSRKYSERYKPTWQAPMPAPRKWQICVAVTLETLLVLALIAVTVAVAIVIMMPV